MENTSDIEHYLDMSDELYTYPAPLVLIIEQARERGQNTDKVEK